LGTQSNAQREVQLLAEWLTTLPSYFKSKTNVNVGAAALQYNGERLTPAQQRMFGVWNDKADARVLAGTEVWIVEAKIVGTGGAYGQVLDYVNEYPSSTDALEFPSAMVVPLILCAFDKPRTSQYFARFGVRTVVFTPGWARLTLQTKIFGSAVEL
jgi:hypothetical protein